MNRRDAVLALATLGATPRTVFALSSHCLRTVFAQARTVRIGALVGRKNSTFWPPIVKRLGELGYVEGKNLILDYRSADGVPERFAPLARELVEAKCDVVFAIGAELSARALLDTKAPVPIVIIANDYDPVKAGIVASLRRPGGNVTGVVITQIELAAKRMEIMRELLPTASRYLVLSDVFTKTQLDATLQAAQQLRMDIVVETFGSQPYDIEAALTKTRAPRINALIVLSSPVLLEQRAKISALALKQRLPVSTSNLWLEDTGFVLYYSADQAKLATRAAEMATSILRGRKPAEIPVEQPTIYEMVINLKTAKALGIKVPQSILLRADRVIH